MHIAIIGLGSMGKRRIRLLREMHPEFGIVGIDGREDRRIETEELFVIKTYDRMDAIIENIDCAFVCTSPLSHASVISSCLSKGWHVFSEINLIQTDYEKNIMLAENLGRTLFLSSTFLYREEIRYIQTLVDDKQRWNYSYHVGQYLPDWHPWESYKDFFVGNKKTNGCREILAIELPWITHIFGKIKEVRVTSDKMSELDIDFDDNYMIQVIHENGNKGMLLIDVVSPVAVRKLEAYTEGKYIFWEGTPEGLRVYNPNKKQAEPVLLTEQAARIAGYKAFIVENAYSNEIKEFLAVIQKKKEAIYGFKEDLEILNLIDSMGA